MIERSRTIWAGSDGHQANGPRRLFEFVARSRRPIGRLQSRRMSSSFSTAHESNRARFAYRHLLPISPRSKPVPPLVLELEDDSRHATVQRTLSGDLMVRARLCFVQMADVVRSGVLFVTQSLRAAAMAVLKYQDARTHKRRNAQRKFPFAPALSLSAFTPATGLTRTYALAPAYPRRRNVNHEPWRRHV